LIFWSSFPFIRLVIPFGLGIYLASTYSLSVTPFSIAVLLALLLGFLVLHFFNRNFSINYFSGILVTGLFCVLGIMHGSTYNLLETKGINEAPHSAIWVGEVKSLKRKQGHIQSLVVQVEKFKKDSVWEESNFRLLVYNRDSLLDARPGDVISGKGKLQLTTAPQNPAQFNYQGFLKYKNIFLITFEDAIIQLKYSHSPVRYAELARAAVIEIYEKLEIKNENLAVLVALTLGDKSYLDVELQKQYAGAGAMHILAVSGLHVGIVFLIFNFLLSKLPDRFGFRVIQTCILLSVIWAFAFLAGLTPSVQRAGWMFSFVILSKLLKRNSNILNSIAVSAFLLLLIDPNNLFQLGFQLSYSAVIGIVLMHPVIYTWLYIENGLLDKIWSLLVVSLAAQIATLPFTLAYFHQFPNYFLLANLFVIPVAFGIVAGSVIVVSLFLLVGTDLYLAVLLDVLLSFLNQTILVITGLPGAISEGIWVTSSSIIFIICIILVFIAFLYYRAASALVLGLCFLVCIQVNELFNAYDQLLQKQLTFYALANPTWSLVHGQRAEIYSLDGGREYDKRMVENHMNSIGVRELKWITVNHAPNQVIAIGNQTVLLFPSLEIAAQLQQQVDFVIQGSDNEPLVFGKAVVLDYYYRKSTQLARLSTKSNYYNFRNDEAFITIF